jgi:hypothetical protein
MLMTLFGQVHPLSGGWTLDCPTVLTISERTWTVEVIESNVVVRVESEEPNDLKTFINEVRSAVGAIVDALGFGMATPLRLEMTHLVKESHETLILESTWTELLDAEGHDFGAHLPEHALAPVVTAATQSLFYRLALADAQRAIEFPDDTAFYCYRARESLCRALAPGSAEDKVGSREWEHLRQLLSIERSDIDAIQDHAVVRRHGRHTRLSEDDRRTALLLVRKAIRDAVAHL